MKPVRKAQREQLDHRDPSAHKACRDLKEKEVKPVLLDLLVKLDQQVPPAILER